MIITNILLIVIVFELAFICHFIIDPEPVK